MRSKIIAIVTGVALNLIGCYTERVAPASDIIISMVHTPSSIPADGVSRTLISITLPDETSDANNSITLTASKGVFEIAGKTTITLSALDVIGSDGKNQKVATAWLISSTDETKSYIAATVKSYMSTDSISFTRSYPDSIDVRVDKLIFVPSTTAELTVTTQIKRNIGRGTPSAGQPVTLTARDNSGNTIGRFRNFTTVTDVAGTCVNYFSIDPSSTYTGPVTFVASVPIDAMGTTRTDQQTITISH